MTRQEICEIFREKYGIEIDVKTVSRQVYSLKKADYKIKPVKKKGFYLTDRLFDDNEMKILYYGLLTNNLIEESTATALIEKLDRIKKLALPTTAFTSDTSSDEEHLIFKNVCALKTRKIELSELKKLQTKIEVLNDAINENLVVSFKMKNKDKKPAGYIERARPYRIFVYLDRYYLMASIKIGAQNGFPSYRVEYYALDNISRIQTDNINSAELRNTNLCKIEPYYEAWISKIDEIALAEIKKLHSKANK